MCIGGHIIKVMHGNVPKVGYKVMRRVDKKLETPYKYQQLTPGVFELPNSKKTAKKVIKHPHNTDYLNKGRFSVLLNKKAAKEELVPGCELWRVQIKSNTAFIGFWTGKEVAVVDSIKLERRIAKYGLWKRLINWL